MLHWLCDWAHQSSYYSNLRICKAVQYISARLPQGDVWLTDADVNQPAYYGLVSNVAGRTPDLVVVPQAGVVFASPGKKLSEHGGLMQSDLNVALMVYAPQLATAGTVYSSTVRLSLVFSWHRAADHQSKGSYGRPLCGLFCEH